MIKIILAFTLAIVALQAQETVHYDKKEVKKAAISKPNHPGENLYINR
ncbi:hypothetical protein [Sulfurimonas autotrophica]|uniref:Uncharacterized protein n=1 Tax=Sulfurimonas autotrophica (strain ATCC BAA-671 / DSM 16294 / JCM 11897 / OK10) TaxID=563040 RepID=E0UTS1_SULAO|nr:hypothetical protein [Sulfurimonas autotrophica]ADN08302.1 hypothetical protein Saut_0253 [Sulfurimonas autotrophica DSM 16294]